MKNTLLALTLSWMLPAGALADRVLCDFATPPKIVATDARAVVERGVLRLEASPSRSFPGAAIEAPGGTWDLSSFERIQVDVKNTSPRKAQLSLRIDNTGANGREHCCNGTIDLEPGASGTLTITLTRGGTAIAKRLNGMRGYPGGLDPAGTFDPAKVTQVLLFVNRPKEETAFEVDNLRAVGSFALDEKTFFPFIDTFGQYIHKDWPGKVKSLEDLRQRRADEAAELSKNPGPSGWTKYGGWAAGPQLKATGFFRTEKREGKWWLVDPEGRLFWSNGIDCVRWGSHTPVEDRDGWFREFPGDRPEFERFFSRGRSIKGHFTGRTPRTFSFEGANLLRKYGDGWEQAYADIAHRRLRSWGMNTIGNWSDPRIIAMGRTAYVATLRSAGPDLPGSEGYWGKFRDVFDEQFAIQTRRAIAREAAMIAKDPWCIGVFVDNELSWGDETSLALAALASPDGAAAKRAFVADLKAKYSTIEKLNAAWGANHANWEALSQSAAAPDKAKAREDLVAFYGKTSDAYFRTVRDALKAAAPNHLYLGCRFAWVNPVAAGSATRFCDVVSYNLYRRSVADFRMPVEADVPLIIGEFHFGALDRGMFHTGLVPTGSQEERAAAYAAYVQGALRHPQFVGCHWFQYADQSTVGRVLDGENYQIGFVDHVDTPNPQIVQASRQVGYDMYRYRLGK